MEKHPDHTAIFDYPKERYIVKIGDSVILDTTRAILIKEAVPNKTFPQVPYFPI